MTTDKANNYHFADEEVKISIISKPDFDKQKSEKPLIKWFLIGVVLLITLTGVGGLAMYIYNRYFYLGTEMSVSRTPEDNIRLLKQSPGSVTDAGIYFETDTVQDVALNIYRLHGLHGELTKVMPSVNDTTIYFFCRSADYDKEKNDIDPVVIGGKLTNAPEVTRLGYMATVDNRTVIGIAKSNDVMEYSRKNGGYFFRQFILVSNNEIPKRFQLTKSYERRALAHIGDELYMIGTAKKETMWDFAEALRKYGFTDAIYITGGDDQGFYRTSDGIAHPIGKDSINHKNSTWLVWKKNK